MPNLMRKFQTISNKFSKLLAWKKSLIISIIILGLLLIGTSSASILTGQQQDIRSSAQSRGGGGSSGGGGNPPGGGGGNSGGWSVTCSNGSNFSENSCATQTLFNNTHGDGCGVWQTEACATVNATPNGGSCGNSCNDDGGGGSPPPGGGGENTGGWSVTCSNGTNFNESSCSVQTLFNNTHDDGCGVWQTEACATVNATPNGGSCGNSCNDNGGGGSPPGGGGDPGDGGISSGGWTVTCQNGNAYSITSCTEQTDWMNAYNGNFHVACYTWQTAACANFGGKVGGTCDICDSGGATDSPLGGADECTTTSQCENLYADKLGTKDCRNDLGGICFCGGLSCDKSSYPQCTHNFDLIECNTTACNSSPSEGLALYEYTTLEDGSTNCTRVGNCGPPMHGDCE